VTPPPEARAASKCLADHPDFSDLVRAAAEHHRIIPALVLKDYWVTRVLRAVVADPELQGKLLFKGGTSLSKGWGLIDRFSEDVDLLLTGDEFGPVPEGSGVRERRMKRVRRGIEFGTPLRLPDRASLSRREWEFFYVRSDYHIRIRFPLPGHAASVGLASIDTVLVEAGFRGGPYPHERRPLRSLLAEFLENQTAAAAALKEYLDDVRSFQMELLKPERTCAEKLLLLHVRMIRGEDGAREVPTRHYYDVSRLWDRSPDVRSSVKSGSLLGLVHEAAIVSNKYFSEKIDLSRLDLRSSPALNPSPDQLGVLTAMYDAPNERALYYRERPSFERILQSLGELRASLP
jgi:hypothetical protein